MIYCMSDIHGESDRFHAMLELIQLTAEDTLYIIGDVIDRYPGGVDILREVMANPHIKMLKGNHEQMMLETLWEHPAFGARSLWKSNGGGCTYRELVYETDPKEKIEILKFVASLPYTQEITIGDQEFFLVHGYPCDLEEDCLWERPLRGPGDPAAPIPGKTVIIGHTPTPFLKHQSSEPFTIWRGNGIIDIDCGCGNETDLRRLACLRLNDMKEYYV